jgi:hypothetical protein
MDVKILEAEHKEIRDIKPAWERIRVLVDEDEACYTGDSFFHGLPNESPTEKAKRKEPFRVGFFNPTQKLISTAGDFIMRQKIDRQTKSDDLKRFIDRADQSGQALSDFVKNQASPNLRAYGTIFGVVDKPRGMMLNKAQELAAGMPYLNILHPLQVRNWAWGRDGRLLWFRYSQAENIDQEDAFAQPGDSGRETVTWTETAYYRHDDRGQVIEAFEHGFGVVPVAVQSAFVVDSSKTLGKSTFFSSSRHLIMGNNHLSKANMEILKYGSILVIGSNDWDGSRIERERDPSTNLPSLTSQEKTGEIMVIQDMAAKPGYLEKNIEIVDKANAQAWQYFGLAAQSEATGKEALPLENAQAGPQSGVSKAYDFQDMDANLFAHAMDLQAFETQVVGIVAAILKVSSEFSIKYPTSFDVRSFKDKVDQVMQLRNAGFPSELGKRLAMKRITGDITTDPAEQEAINAEIDSASPALPVEPKPEAFPKAS